MFGCVQIMFLLNRARLKQFGWVVGATVFHCRNSRPAQNPPRELGGVKQLPNVCDAFISVFAIFQIEFMVIGPKCCRSAMRVKLEVIFLLCQIQMTKSHFRRISCWRLSERTPWNLPN